jgi:phage shock protein A
MTENLVVRVKRIVSGSVNGLVDSMESAAAETVMREAIREVDRTIDDVRDELGSVIASRHRANRILTLNRSKIEELGGKIKVAVDQNRDDLAEVAIARQIDLEAQIPVLQDTLAEASTRQHELEGYVAALNGRKREMEQDLKAYVSARTDAATTPGGETVTSKINNAERRAENAQSAFDRAFGGSIAGMPKVDRSATARLNELEVMMRSQEVASRLAAVKNLKQAS